MPRAEATLDVQSKRYSALQHQSPQHQITPKAPHPQSGLGGPGLRGHGLHLVQLGGIVRAVLLVQQDDSSFNVVTASARDKERKRQGDFFKHLYVELNENKYDLVQMNFNHTEVICLAFLS